MKENLVDCIVNYCLIYVSLIQLSKLYLVFFYKRLYQKPISPLSSNQNFLGKDRFIHCLLTMCVKLFCIWPIKDKILKALEYFKRGWKASRKKKIKFAKFETHLIFSISLFCAYFIYLTNYLSNYIFDYILNHLFQGGDTREPIRNL